MDRPPPTGGRRGLPLDRFYRHLVVSTAVQVTILVAGLASDAIAAWCAGVLMATLGIAAHAHATYAAQREVR
jgi:hypothetical protein